MITLAINIIGILLIAVIVWWFWLSEPPSSQVKAENLIEIKVKNGVYQPPNIQAQTNQAFTLRFIREDPSPCAATVVFSSLNISQSLPLHEPIDLFFNLKNPGTYEFTCQMGMYRGKLIVH